MMGLSKVLNDDIRGQAGKDPTLPDPVRPVTTLVVGLGNPILGDDGFGWIVAGQVKGSLHAQGREDVAIEFLSLGGLSLMEELIGYERVILIDAINSDTTPPGLIQCTLLGDIQDPSMGHTGSTHDTTLQNAIQIGRSLGARLPDDIMVVGVTTEPCYDFSEELSPPIAAAVPRAVEIVIELLTQNGT